MCVRSKNGGGVDCWATCWGSESRDASWGICEPPVSFGDAGGDAGAGGDRGACRRSDSKDVSLERRQ